MDRLAEQVVAWHNRHPLAKRITIYDVHTMGLVALPFMRSGMGDSPIEPVLTDEVSAESLAAAWDAAGDADDGEAAAADQRPASIGPDDETRPASHQQRAASTAATKPAKPATGWQRLNPLRWRASEAMHWPVFSERFIANLSPRRVASFALNHGYSNPPRGPEWPQRVVAIDEAMLERGAPRGASGAWPYEIYLLSAGIDAGKSRSRVLVGIGPNRQSAFLGKRCWSLVRLGLLALVLTGIGTVAAALLLPHGLTIGHGAPDEAASAASAASASASMPVLGAAPAPAASAASATSAASSAELVSAASPASQAGADASVPTAAVASPSAPMAASAAASSVAGPAASSAPPVAAAPAPADAVTASAVGASQAAQGSIPNIRPQLSHNVKPPRPAASRPETGTPAPAPAPAQVAASKPPVVAPNKAAEPARSSRSAEPSHSKPAGSATATPSAAPPRLQASTPAAALERPQLQPGDLPAGAETPAADGKRVALVGPASANKADAEALMARMLAQVQQTMGKSAPVQAQVFKTPDGWRPAVWPFASREQAQLVNATLVARGLRAKAIDF